MAAQGPTPKTKIREFIKQRLGNNIKGIEYSDEKLDKIVEALTPNPNDKETFLEKIAENPELCVEVLYDCFPEKPEGSTDIK